MSTDNSLADYYSRWTEDQCIEKFASKDVGSFFDSERHFLRQVAGQVQSVLDVGCASGHFLKLLEEHIASFSFMGIDLVEGNIRSARAFYPQARFETVNAVQYDTDERFDLVNATGVIQHEPEYDVLLRKMLTWSNRYVLFDAKFADIPEPIVDLTRSYTRGDNHNLYFNLFNYRAFIALCRSLPEVGRISVFGYFTKPNARTIIPDSVNHLVSANLLIEKGDQAPEGATLEASDEVKQALG